MSCVYTSSAFWDSLTSSWCIKIKPPSSSVGGDGSCKTRAPHFRALVRNNKDNLDRQKAVRMYRKVSEERQAVQVIPTQPLLIPLQDKL